MLQLYASNLCEFVRRLTHFEIAVLQIKAEQTFPVTPEDRGLFAPILEYCDALTSMMWMPATSARKGRLEAALEAGCHYPELGFQLRMLREAMEDELKSLLILHMPPGQAVHYFASEKLLGEPVIARFPQLGSDIDEAAKCLGTGRYTAAVFHLMRVMEVGVQEFGTKLGVALLDARNVEKNWHNILEEVDKTIRAMPKGAAGKADLAELSALLSAVKLAWRNEVMHPKASYAAEEAENILGATKAYMGRLVVLV